MIPSWSSLGVLLLVVGDKLGTDTRRVSYLISVFMGGLTSIVRTGPRGRPPPLAKSRVDDCDDGVVIHEDADEDADEDEDDVGTCTDGRTVKAWLPVANDEITNRESFILLE
jgi:hypothetical protein